MQAVTMRLQKTELDKANKDLTSYLDKIKKEEEAKKAEEEAKKAEEEAKKKADAKKAAEEAKKTQSEAQKKTGTVNTGAETALGFYALSGVLGLAGVAFTGKHARKRRLILLSTVENKTNEGENISLLIL